MEKKNLSILFILLGISIFFNLVGTCTSCTSKQFTKENAVVINDKLDNDFYDKIELDLILEIDRYKSAAQELYDWNTIVRTTTRPDDKMKEYYDKIEELEDELADYNKNKAMIDDSTTIRN